MGNSTIWKPEAVNSWKGGPVFLADSGTSGTPVITGPDGKTYTGKFVNNNEGRKQWVFPSSLVGMNDLKVSYGGETNTIAVGGQRYEGNSLGTWGKSNKDGAPVGTAAAAGSSSGIPAGDQPGQIGNGFFPAKQTFPGVTLANYSPITAAPYNFTDPFKFAQQYGAFARGEVQKNFNQSQDLALQSLNTELKGLATFAPAAAALKRQETSVDNQFNQQQRLAQVNQALPGVSQDLNNQAARARSYAAGDLPDAQLNKALELGIRSNAADISSSGGFGASSSVATKVSNLMSAEERFKIAQYGEGLTTNNINEKAQLLLAPTEYSNAGQQINVTPSLSGSQLTGNYLGQLNQETGIPATTALASNTQQNQFTTGLEQQTRQFNAGNQLGLSEFNAGQSNNFALQQFGYNTQYAGAVAGAAQTNANINLELQQQAQYQQIAQQLIQQQQQTQQLSSIFSGVLSLLGQGAKPGGQGGGAGSVLGQIGSWAAGLFGLSGNGGTGSEGGGTFSATDPNSVADSFINSLNLGGGNPTFDQVKAGGDSLGYIDLARTAFNIEQNWGNMSLTEKTGTGIGAAVGSYIGGPEGGSYGAKYGGQVADAVSSAWDSIF